MKRPSRRAAGFTILEMLVVLAILSLALGAAVMAKPDSSGARLSAAARSVVATLRVARARAMERNADLVVLVDPQDGAIGSTGALRKLPEGMSVAFTVAAPEQSGRLGGFRFYPDGQSSGGEIALRLNGRVARIAVNWLTGEPRIEP